MNTWSNVPPEIVERLMACLEEVDGDYEVKDFKALLDLVIEHGTAFPALRELVKLNEDAVRKHYEETGQAPPGVKIVKKTTAEGSNVVRLDVIHGPRSTK